MKKSKRIAILTGGGDCPGSNAVIRAVTKKAMQECCFEVIGIEDGFHGLVENRFHTLHWNDVSGILTLGGTILGTSKTASPYHYPVKKGEDIVLKDVSKKALKNIKSMDIDALICIGGDGSLGVSYKLFEDGVPVVGVPKTIDNDISGTEVTFGFDTAVSIATEGIDRLHTTAQSHHRIMIIEVMGHKAGWIALHSGIAGGGDIVLIPEIPYSIDVIAKKVRERNKKGKRFSIIVVAEGAKPQGGDVVISRIVKESPDSVRLGGIAFVLGSQIEKLTGLETRAVVLGHLQRGGTPSSADRVICTQLGTKAMDMVLNNEFGYMAGFQNGQLRSVHLREAAVGPRIIPLDHPLLQSARAVGTCFGDY